MQQIKFGDILSIRSGIIVQGCNAQGVMGSGVAKAIREKYPQVYEEYRGVYEQEGLPLGSVVVSMINQGIGLLVASAITQQFFGKDGKKYISYEAIHKAMMEIAGEADAIGLPIHYPLIGAGLGGGDWSIIQAIIDSVFAKYPQVQRTLWIRE